MGTSKRGFNQGSRKVGLLVAAVCAIASFSAKNNYSLLGELMTASTSTEMLAPTIKGSARVGHRAEKQLRVIALCACCPRGKAEGDCISANAVFDTALNRLSQIVPEISYAGMHEIKEPNAPVSCEDHVETFMSRRLSEGNLEASNKTTVVEIIHTQSCKTWSEYMQHHKERPLDEALAGRNHTLGGNEAVGVGLHTPPIQTHFQRHVKDWGEVFLSHAKRQQCGMDSTIIHTYRSRQLEQHQYDNCPVIHNPNLLRWAEVIRMHRVKEGDSPPNETTLSMLTRRRTREEAERALASKKHFCVLVTRTTMTPNYQADGLLRHALRRLLGKRYKECLGLQAWLGGKDLMREMNMTDTGPWNTYVIQSPFKFVITMANEQSEGYLVEKTVHPYLAGSIAITATPGVGKYVNADSLVSCRVSDTDIAKVQQYYRGQFKWMPFNTTPDQWEESGVEPVKYDPYTQSNGRDGDEAVLEFVTDQWEEALTPCVDAVAALDKDDNAYVEKLMQPYVLNEGRGSLFDGTYLAMQLLHWYKFMGSPLVKGLLVAAEGIVEQTSGWGLP